MCGVRERNAVMLKEALLADVYFTVGSGSTQRRIAAHKCMLVAASSVFHAMFFGELAEDKEVAIPDVEPEAFLNMLTWVHARIDGFQSHSDILWNYVARKPTYIKITSAISYCSKPKPPVWFMESFLNSDRSTMFIWREHRKGLPLSCFVQMQI